MNDSRWDRFVSKSLDVVTLVMGACFALIMAGLLIAGIATFVTKGF